jgi:hypothetical protein
VKGHHATGFAFQIDSPSKKVWQVTAHSNAGILTNSKKTTAKRSLNPFPEGLSKGDQKKKRSDPEKKESDF